MATEPRINWAAIDADPRFQELHRRKSRFLWILMALSIVYYFLLPIGAAYCPGLFRAQIWGPINFGIVFALSQFVVAWLIAYVYYRKATREFDPMAEELARSAASIARAP
jgi:uncharacterized membrane protein (DUF485 family)